MRKLPGKWLLLFLLLLVGVVFVSPVRAYVVEGPGAFLEEGPGYKSYWEEATTGSENLNAESTEKIISDANLGNWAYRLVGCSTEACKQAVGVANAGGALGGTVRLVGFLLENKPVSGVEYVASVGERLRIVKPVYAQTGTGFAALEIVRDVWRTFRNVAYFFFVLIFMGIGLAIMFRMKISPQAVVTVQSAIPKIVVALLLVTFSYAIAGFMVDIMYVAMGLIGLMIGSGIWIPKIFQMLHETGSHSLADMNLLTFVGLYFINGMEAAKQISDIVNPLTMFFGSLPAVAEDILRALSFFTPFGAGAVLVMVILGVALLFSFLRLFFVLLKAYVTVLILVIIAPFQIMLTALPGYEGGFGSWLRNLIANLAVFPATVAMLALASVIAGQTVEDGGKFWVPPPINPALTPSPVTQQEAVLAMIGFGILMLTPQVASMVKEALKASEFKYGSAIGAPIGAAAGVLSYPFRTAGGMAGGAIRRGVEQQIADEGRLGIPKMFSELLNRGKGRGTG